MKPGTAVLLTGGAGYVGSHAAKCLRGKGLVPITFDNLSRGHREAVKWGPLETGDLSDRARLVEALRKHQPAAVLHFAAFAYVGESTADPALYYRNNFAGTLNLLEAMRETGVGKLVFSSTCATFGNPERLPIDETAPQRPINPYGRSKLAVERMIEDFSSAYGLRAVILRYFNAAGADPEGEIGEWHEPETHLIPLVLDAVLGRIPYLEIFGDDYHTRDGTCVRDYIHVSDLAEAHALALDHLLAGKPSDHFNLGTGTGHSVKEILKAAAKVCGKEAPARMAPRRVGDPAELVAGNAKATAALGWRPRLSSLETLLETAWNWHRRLAERGGWPV